MKYDFWKKLQTPFFALAPMADVTDEPFRQIVVSCGKPDIFYTEFIPCDGLCSDRKKNLMKHLKFKENERPIVAQLFGANPDNFYNCAKLVKSLGFDGIDINMGCPDKKVLKQGAGAELIRNPKHAQKIIAATQKGAGNLPVSVKTRLGFSRVDEIDVWIPTLLKTNIAALAIHGRTVKEMSKVPAHWDAIRKVVKLAQKTKTLVIGNGDIESRKQGVEYAKRYGVDGIMIGRGIFANLFIFSNQKTVTAISRKQQLELLKKHVILFEKFWGKDKSFDTMKKFFKMYISGCHSAKLFRTKLMQTKTSKEVHEVLKNNIFA